MSGGGGGRDLGAVIPPAEREQAIARLSDAFAHDVLPLDEFERRVAAVYQAASRTEIGALTADLPAIAAAPGAAVAPIPTMAERVTAVFGSVERGGFLEVPRRLEVRAVMGSVELDLSEARFGAGVTEISVRTVMGSIEIRLPAGIQVENHGSGFLGSFECSVGTPFAHAAVGRPLVRITGRALLGSVAIADPAGAERLRLNR